MEPISEILIAIFNAFMNVFIIFLLILFFASFKSRIDNLLSNWHYSIGEFFYSSKEFYELVKEHIEGYQIPGVRIKEVTHTQGGITSTRRTYLRVQKSSLIFDICAAPYGTGFFFSWWLGENVGIARRTIRKIPSIGKWLERIIYPATFYKIDTEIMFQNAVKHCVETTINCIFEEKGVRKLEDHQLKPTVQDIFKR